MPSRIVALACPVELSAAADGDGALPRFTMQAYNGGAMRVSGWRHPVVVDLAGMEIPSQRLPIRYQHDASAGVGHTEAIDNDGRKLAAAGIISRDTAFARDVVISGRNGFPWQASIGASVVEHEFIKDGAAVEVNGQSFVGPVNVARRTVLGEISFVDLGADRTTTASIAAHAAEDTHMDQTERMAALVAAHPEHDKAIMAGIIAGKEDADILAEIEAAAVKAKREADEAELAALRASAAAHADAIAAKDAEIAELKAKIEAATAHTANIPADPGPAGKGSALTWTKAEFAAASPAERLAHAQRGGIVAA